MYNEAYTESTACPHCGHVKHKIEGRINETLFIIFLLSFAISFIRRRRKANTTGFFDLVNGKYKRTPSDYAVLEDWGLT